ncbi:glycoside hydrolase 100 family protein [Pedobacter aquatilis]|uniref:glycoside hydrolase 100 family protein n=1 Tax=Pedobacter aquatilis TaxID=351343 RepID=UPI00292FA6B3|nr:glycoside hydrolase 100 family protein [Pedobacter aquatilis]
MMIDSKSYSNALNLLHQASTPFGFVAAVQEHDNYKRVWTRDGVITSIAAMLSGDELLIKTAKRTLDTLFNNQHTSGFMPSNVSPEDGKVSYGGTTGRADNPSWAVIGISVYTLLTDDYTLWDKFTSEIVKCLSILDAWEFNGKHLIYVPQSGDWADEYIQHGYILFDQLLRIWALKLASTLSGNKTWEEKASAITGVVRNNYWKSEKNDQLYASNLSHQLKSASDKYWLMGFNPSRIYNYFDLQANTFSLLLRIGNEEQDATILNTIKELYDSKNSLIPSFYPTIGNEDLDMNELLNNYAYTFRNQPGYFHNGGLWPVWNGWLVSALKKHNKIELAAQLTQTIHQSNTNLFNECLNGDSNVPCGVPNCTWSAAGAVIAEQSLLNSSFDKLFKF